MKGVVRLLTCCSLIFLPMVSRGQKVNITVSNSTSEQRSEVVEIDARKVYQRLQSAYGSPLIVRNAFGQQVASQLTSDSLLLVDAAVFPKRKTMFTVTKGVPRNFKSAVDGQLYAWRVDDFTWENDRCAYRVYGPALQRTGEKAFGIDVWLKSVPYLVVADRYANVYAANQEEKRLRRQGETEAADSIKRDFSLHLDHGNGLDCYNVGPTLGCGAPALMNGDSIVMPYCFCSYRVLDNGPLRFRAEFVYQPTDVNGEKGLVEHRLITLDKGSSFNRVTVWYENQRRPQPFCSGFVVHDEGSETVHLGRNFVEYADPTDNPSGHGFQIYVAALFPKGKVRSRLLKNTRLGKGIAGHAICETTIRPNEKVTYYFGAGWIGSGISNQKAWQLEISSFMEGLYKPLGVNVE